jgi:hypothetical protein
MGGRVVESGKWNEKYNLGKRSVSFHLFQKKIGPQWGPCNLRDRYQGRCIKSTRRVFKNRTQNTECRMQEKARTRNLKTRTPEPDLYCFFEVSCANAACADGSFFDGSTFLDPDGLQVRKVPTLCLIVSMADVVPHHGAFST